MENERIKSTSQFEFQTQLRLTEEQSRALLAITVYGSKSFLEFFYRNLGESSLKKHEEGLISLFDTVKQELPKHLKKFDDMRDVWKGNKTVINS